MTQGIKLIVGLGNPGPEYDLTRHNAGALFIERLADRHNVGLRAESKFFGLTGRLTIDGQDIRLLIPTTFMNRSGQAVAALAGFYRITPEEILVAHDELDLPPGVVKCKKGGGHGGHNGLRDIMKHLSGKSFVRVRIGVSRPPPGWDVANYVLASWSVDEQSQLEDVMQRAADAVEVIVTDGAKAAMNHINQRRAIAVEPTPTAPERREHH